jgi:hypothetical protein
MTDDVFERYLQYRFQQAGAVTAGQRLDIVHKIKEEARSGMVPLDEHSVATLDINDPSVQAVLRGESVSVGGRTLDPARRFVMPKLTGTPGKLLILLVIFLIPLVLGLFYIRSKKSAEIREAASMALTATALVPSATVTLPPAPTLAVTETPGVPPTATLMPDQVLYSEGKAADGPASPASIEIGGRRLVVLQGEIDRKSGVWQPKGVEWLQGTSVRKVIAIPMAMMLDASISIGDPISVRYRNGYTATYAVTASERVVVDQIEILRANKPSIAVLFYTGNLQDPYRTVIFGEIPLPPEARVSAQPTPSLPVGLRAVALTEGVRLRQSPSLSGVTIGSLGFGTEIYVITQIPPVSSNDILWFYVQTSLGNGWVAENLITLIR